MNRSNDGSDVTILKNNASRFLPNADDDIHHGPGQIIGPDDLIGEQQTKSGVDRAQQAVAQIRFFAWLHRIDIRGSRYKGWENRMRGGPSRLLPYTVRKPSDFVPSDPLRSRSRMRKLLSGCSCGELVRTRL